MPPVKAIERGSTNVILSANQQTPLYSRALIAVKQIPTKELVLWCKTVEGVHKELLMYALVYNLVRKVMLAGAQRQQVVVERLSFIDAVRWLAEAVRGPVEFQSPSMPRKSRKSSNANAHRQWN